MPSALYDATVGAFIHGQGQMLRLLRKAEEFCGEQGIPPDAILQRRLIADMHPFAYQVKSTRIHSLGAVEGVRRGGFSPDETVPPDSFAGLGEMIAEARAGLETIMPDEIDALADRDMIFAMGSYRAAFTGRGFLLSFSVPNFYFHASTAYGLLRAAGVELGKVDYLGRVGTRL